MRYRCAIAALCCVAAAVAAGCGSGGGGGGGGGKSSSAAKKPVRVDVVLAALDNAFYVAQKQGIEAEAARLPGVKLSVSAGRERTSSDDVIGLIEDAIAKSPDAIAVNGSEDAPLIPVLKRVVAAHIPLVLFDAAAPQLKGQYATYIGTDNAAGGRADGTWLREHMPHGARIAMVLCVAGNPITNARVAGFKAGLGPSPKYKIVAQADAKCDREQGRKVMEDMLSAHPNLNAVFSTSDGQAAGAVEALDAAKKDPMFVSFDAQPEAVKAIESGDVIDASAGWSAKQLGAEALDAAVAAARGEKVPPQKIIPVTVVDKTNAASWHG
jgi:ribose transport system substrate-binding protein